MVVISLAGGCAQEAAPAGALAPGVQVFSGTAANSSSPALCSGEEALRTVTFGKQSAATRLRITYKDTVSAVSTKGGRLSVVGKVDGAAVTSPTGLQMGFVDVPRGPNLFAFLWSFTLIGYADGVPQGNHSLAFVYAPDPGVLPDNTFICFRRDEPFLIEIAETQ
jgi:hypothetical protein